MPESQPSMESLKAAIHAVFDERRGVDERTHRNHHQFIEAELQRRERRQALTEKIKAQVFGWGAIGVLGGVGTAVYQWLKSVKGG